MKDRRSGTEWVFLAAAIGLGCLLAWAGGRLQPPAPAPEEVASGPSFRLATLEGERLSPSDFRGQVVVVDFWATWCIPCRFQAKVLDELYPELQADGVEVLGVNLGEPVERVREHVADAPQPWPVLLDTEDRLTAELRIEALPALMILDPEGSISYFGVGILDASGLRREVARAGAS